MGATTTGHEDTSHEEEETHEEEQETKDEEEEKKEEPRGLDADVKSLVEKARLQEKAKLRKELEAAKAFASENTTLKDALSDLRKSKETLEAELKKAKEEEDTGKKKKKEEPTIDTDAIIDEVSGKFRQEIDSIRAENESLKKMAVATEEARKKAELEAYRTSKIAEAKEAGGLIEGLVQGSSPEEIDLAVIEARQEYAKVVEAARKGLGVPPGTPPPDLGAAGSIQPQAGPGGKAETPEEFAQRVKGMSPEDYAKERKKLLKSAGSYQGAAR